jgi:sigma-B regulation protein RsbU (phosphoserine phosphatase)
MPGFYDYLSDKYNTENIQAINQRLIELSSLFEISQILNSSLDLKNILNNILLIPMGRLMVSKGVFFLKSDQNFLAKFWKGLSSEIETVTLTISDIPTDKSYLLIPDIRQNKYGKLVQLTRRYNLALMIPIYSREELIGILFYGYKLNKQPYTEEEKDFLTSLANLSANSIENALKVEEIQNINTQLDQRIQQLKTLFDIAQGLSATLESDKIIKLLIYALMGQMLVYHYGIIVCNQDGILKIDCKGFLQDNMESLVLQEPELKKIDSASLVENLEKVSLRKKLNKMRARVFIPMRHQNKFLGFIILGDKINKQKYSGTDLEFLSTLVSQAVISIENARLFRETLEKQRIEQELQVAKTIQKKLLPREIISIKGYDIWGLNNSSKEVGGDYFDIIPISELKVALAIGDVSGKSVPAALIMANLQAGLRTIISESLGLNEVVSRLNRLIYQNTDLDKYITFFVGILDNQSNEFYYVNAGHNPPILQHQGGSVSMLEEGGIILGMLPDYTYKTGKIKIQHSDILICYTDGVNEALNKKNEEYGEERLKDFIKANRNLNSRDLAEKIVDSISQFTAGAAQYDDITLLVVKRIG